MEEDELFYLQPGFDLSSLTVPRLRSILVSHDISYPASAKKPQLIQILTDEILPKARKLLSAQARVRRTSKGITSVSSSQDAITNGDEEGDGGLMPPPPVPKTPRSRKSKSKLVDDDGVASTPSTSKQPRTPGTRKSSAKHPRASDTETDAEKPRASSRKTRKSATGVPPVEATPAVRIEEPDSRIKRESLDAGESPFTDDNPFQSGSSPSGEPRRVSSPRKSIGATTDRRKSTSRKRETASPSAVKQQDGITPPSRSTFEFPVARLGSAGDDMQPTEEFTPEAAEELEQDGAGASQLTRKRRNLVVRRKKKSTSTVVKSIPWAILTTLLAAGGAWYRSEKINIGYCGVGAPSWSLASNTNIPAWVHEKFEPTCEPCPQHAICYPGMEVKCEDDFVVRPHPLNLNGAVPLPPTCEPDGEKARRVKAVADRAVEELRERRAAYECGEEVANPEASNDDIEDVKIVVLAGETKLEIPEETLKNEVSKMRRRGMSEEEFEELWRGALGALGEIVGRDEIDVVRDGSGRLLLSSSSLARLPFTCAIRRSLLRAISRNRVPLSVLVSLVATLLYARRRLIDYKTATAQIPGLVETTLDRLATQAALAADGRVSEAFISVGQLRDDVLRGTFSVSERERVWKGVRVVVEGNSNVRAATREGGRTGEWSRVWEWIGPVNLAPGLEGRRSGGGGLIHGAEDSNEGEDGTAAAGRKWDEGRPIY